MPRCTTVIWTTILLTVAGGLWCVHSDALPAELNKSEACGSVRKMMELMPSTEESFQAVQPRLQTVMAYTSQAGLFATEAGKVAKHEALKFADQVYEKYARFESRAANRMVTFLNERDCDKLLKIVSTVGAGLKQARTLTWDIASRKLPALAAIVLGRIEREELFGRWALACAALSFVGAVLRRGRTVTVTAMITDTTASTIGAVQPEVFGAIPENTLIARIEARKRCDRTAEVFDMLAASSNISTSSCGPLTMPLAPLQSNSKRIRRNHTPPPRPVPAVAAVQQENAENSCMSAQEISLFAILNEGDERDLLALKGVGEKTARSIIQYRETQGPLARVPDLRSAGMSQVVLTKLMREHCVS